MKVPIPFIFYVIYSLGPSPLKLTFLGALKLETLADYLKKQYGAWFIMGRAGPPARVKTKIMK